MDEKTCHLKIDGITSSCETVAFEGASGFVYLDEPITITTSSNTYYYLTNSQYSVMGLTDSSGNLVQEYSCDPYGKQTLVIDGGIDQPFGFTGRRLDTETGLWYFRARMYSDDLGRFINRDLLGYVEGMNLYRSYFVVNGVDPIGLRSREDYRRPVRLPFERPVATKTIDGEKVEFFDCGKMKNECCKEKDDWTYVCLNTEIHTTRSILELFTFGQIGGYRQEVEGGTETTKHKIGGTGHTWISIGKDKPWENEHAETAGLIPTGIKPWGFSLRGANMDVIARSACWKVCRFDLKYIKLKIKQDTRYFREGIKKYSKLGLQCTTWASQVIGIAGVEPFANSGAIPAPVNLYKKIPNICARYGEKGK